ncbi:MAG: DUF1003 domain-containing protein [Anaerolineae bacterium]|nr:DUF1003 domain-containing protein [Anaerolineae bacterium]
MPISNANMLRNVPLFALLDNDEITALAEQMEQQHFWAGQMIFQQGDPGEAMYVVHSGAVELFIRDRGGERVVVDKAEPGDLFGEFSLLDQQPRSASAKATQETLLFVVDRTDLQRLFAVHPDAAFDMLAMLSRRIRSTDALVSERVVATNPNEAMNTRLTINQRLADLFAMIAGDMRFVYLSAVWFAVWIIWNLGIIPGIEPFDPFPFGLLTMIVSLEAIFMSIFVLVSQNRQAERDKVRNDIEYDINIKAELEVRALHDKVDVLQELMIQHLREMNSNVVRLQTQTGTSPAVKNSDLG